MSQHLLVVIVAYRSDEHLRECLAELGTGLPVVVVDNDANPSTATSAADAGARYVAMPTNAGFAAGVNAGIADAWDHSSDVLLLNPDARIAGDDVRRLAATLHGRPRLAAVGPRLVGPDGAEQLASWPMPSPAQVWADALGLTRFWRGRRFVTGAVLLLNGAALGQVGGLDERYFLYAEEADWQMRAQRAGWDVAVDTTVTAHHVGGASSSDSSRRDELFRTSGRAFAQRWYGWFGVVLMRLGTRVAAARRRLTGLRRQHG